MLYKNEKLNERDKWPEGKHSNAAIYITKDFKITLKNRDLISVLLGFGDTPQAQLTSLETIKAKKPTPQYPSSINYSAKPDGLDFVFLMLEPTAALFSGSNGNAKIFKGIIKSSAASFGTIITDGSSEHIKTVFTKGSTDFTDFDKQFLRVLYGKHVHSGMVLLKAKRLMLEELVDCFNAN